MAPYPTPSGDTVIDFGLAPPRFHDPGERQPYRRTFEFCRTVDELGYAGGEGRTPRICLMREAWVGEDDAEVEREWYPRALSFHRYYWDAGTRGDEHDPVPARVAAGDDPPYQEFVRDRAFAGTPELVVDEIRRWHDAIGFDECCLIFATGREATTQVALTRAVTLFAEEVFPSFR